jgi:hypothetical protein
MPEAHFAPSSRTQKIPRRSYHRTGSESYITDSMLCKRFLHFFYNVIDAILPKYHQNDIS